jgi:hypothetical protein
MSTLFDLYGGVSLEIREEGGSADKLRKTFDHFVSTDADRDPDPDIVCELSNTRPDPETVLGDPDSHYGRDGDRFVIQKPEGYGFISVDSDWEHYLIAPDIFHYIVAYLIEFEVRKRLVSEGRTLIHASGFQLDGTTYLFPAWRYTGKTSTGLAFLQSGANYLSDDRLWVGTDGTALGYPVPVNMMPSNIETYPGASGATQAERRRMKIADFLYENVDADRSFVDKVAFLLTRHYLDPDLGRELVSLDTLMPDSRYVERAEIDNVVVLRTWLDSPDNSVAVEEISGRDAVTDLMGMNYYEWDRDLREYYTAYDMLFPGKDESRAEELDSLIDAEERNLAELLDGVATYRGLVPREQDWKSTGIAEDVLETFTGLHRPAELQQ